ncbi:putative F-box domain, leucine-rich repeat domain superfamily, F-box-like domain superfamily [Helianthus annuus]|nr:putative F-box domain, leucine-rich repeat domain superfamily, F-box-like domain superfamily [Helianthus annuus]
MDSGHGKIRMKVEGDRLSSLPDDIIHKILSFISTKHAVQTSVLSPRWRYTWTSVPCLNISYLSFRTQAKFSKFVTRVLSGRNNQIELSSVELTFHGKVCGEFVKKILNKVLKYAFSHNVQHLDITYGRPGKSTEFPLSHLSSQSLKHLTLVGFGHKDSITTPFTWDLLALTTLDLWYVTLWYDDNDKSVGLFSNCPNLKNLTVSHCHIVGPNGFYICHPGLSNLTLEEGHTYGDVVTPQLKSLTIRNWPTMHLISAPNLASLHYEADHEPLRLSSELLHLETVDMCIFHPYVVDPEARKIVSLLQQLRSVKFLTLNLELIEILSSSVELISHQPSPFANLKSLKILPELYTNPDSWFFWEDEEQTQPKVTTMCNEVKNYLLDGSPGATFTMVTLEEARNNTKGRRGLMWKRSRTIQEINGQF